MSHKFRIKPIPHVNKNGTESATKKDYVVIDRSRQGSRQVGVASSQNAAEQMINVERQRLIGEHVRKHPNDAAFRRTLYASVVL